MAAMGSRANAVVMRNGSRRVFYSHGAAEHMDALAFFGPQHVVAEITSS